MPDIKAGIPTDRPINVSGLSPPASDRAADAAGAALVGNAPGKIDAGDAIDIGVTGAIEVPSRVMCEELKEKTACPSGGAICVAFRAIRLPGGNGGANGGDGVGPGNASVLTTVPTGELLAGE